MRDLTGKTIDDRYQFGVRLGEGSFAEVYRIHDERRNVDLAAKVLRTDIADDETVLERFRRESEVLARLQHPHIVRFYDFIETDAVTFILLDYVPGETLQSYLHNQGRPLGINEVFTLLKPLTAGLHYAHGEGIVHRDLKPGNILLHQQGNLLITDFGLARVLGDKTTSRKAGASGTPLYMAPEQVLNVDASSATDVYALGVVLYRMLAGRPPFMGESSGIEGATAAKRIVEEHLHILPQPLRDYQSSVPLAVEEVVMRCLNKEPANRPKGVREVYDAMAEAIGAAPSDLTPLPAAQAALPPVAITLPELSQFIRFSTQESSQPLEATATSKKMSAVEEETAENIYPRQVLEGRQRPTIQNHRPIQVQQTLPPDEVSISKPTPPGIVIPPPRSSRQRTGEYIQVETPGMNYSLLLVLGVLLVIASCGALAVYMSGILENNTDAPTQASFAENIPTVTANGELLSPQSTLTGSTANTQPSALTVDNTTPTITVAAAAGGISDLQNQGLIAYASDRGGTLDIYVTDPTAERLRQTILNDPTMNETGPAWSPDGNYIAFYAYPVGDTDADIYIMTADGNNPQNLTNSPDEDDRYVTWSPDGQQLAFHSNRRANDSADTTRDFEIVIYDFASDTITPLTVNDVRDLGPDWSPDGRSLAYHSLDSQSGRSRITIYDLQTDTTRYVTPPTLEARFPTWSPDGTRLAFHVEESDSFSQIYLADVDGEIIRPLLQIAVNDAFPDWSPTGEDIVFHRRTVEGVFGVFRYNFATDTVYSVGDQLRDFFPDWALVTN